MSMHQTRWLLILECSPNRTALVERLAEGVKVVQILDVVLGFIGFLCNTGVQATPFVNLLGLGHMQDTNGVHTCRRLDLVQEAIELGCATFPVLQLCTRAHIVSLLAHLLALSENLRQEVKISD